MTCVGLDILQWPAHQQVQSNHKNAKKNQAQNFNRAHGAKNLQTLQPGDTLRMKDPTDKQWGKPCEVVKRHGPPQARSYIIAVKEGRYRRNRRHLQKIPKPKTNPSDIENSRLTPEERRDEQRANPIRSTRGIAPKRYKDFYR